MRGGLRSRRELRSEGAVVLRVVGGQAVPCYEDSEDLVLVLGLALGALLQQAPERPFGVRLAELSLASLDAFVTAASQLVALSVLGGKT